MKFETMDKFAAYWIDVCDCYMSVDKLSTAWQLSESHLQQGRLLRLIDASATCYDLGQTEVSQILGRYARYAGNGMNEVEAWKELASMLDYYGKYQGVVKSVRGSVQYVEKLCGKTTTCSGGEGKK